MTSLEILYTSIDTAKLNNNLYLNVFIIKNAF